MSSTARTATSAGQQQTTSFTLARDAAIERAIFRDKAKLSKALARAKPMTSIDLAYGRAKAKADRKALEHEREHVAPKRAQTRSMLERYLEPNPRTRIAALSLRQVRAGKRLDVLYQGSGYAPRMVASYGVTGSGGGAVMPGSGPKAKDYDDAMKAMGEELSPIAFAVCVQNLSAMAWAHANGNRICDAIGMLRRALDLLAEHEGL